MSPMEPVTNNELRISIEALEGKIDGIRDDLRRDVREIRDALMGSGGRAGLTEAVIRMDQRVMVLETESRERGVPRSVWIPLIVSSLLALVAIMVTLLPLIRR